jgi:hypothetical protein
VNDPKLDNVSDNYDPTETFPNNLTGYHTVSGDYDASVDIIGVAVNWKFK